MADWILDDGALTESARIDTRLFPQRPDFGRQQTVAELVEKQQRHAENGKRQDVDQQDATHQRRNQPFGGVGVTLSGRQKGCRLQYCPATDGEGARNRSRKLRLRPGQFSDFARKMGQACGKSDFPVRLAFRWSGHRSSPACLMVQSSL